MSEHRKRNGNNLLENAFRISRAEGEGRPRAMQRKRVLKGEQRDDLIGF